jgi:hypothetical protein
MTIDELINKYAGVKDEMARLNAELKELGKTKDDLDHQLFNRMDEQGLSRTANGKASVSINEDTVPEVINWDALYAHCSATEDYSYLQRRASSTACKEMWKLGQEVPGVVPRDIRRINFRSL